MAILSDNLLRKIFQTPTGFIFLQEYQTLSNDYTNEYLKLNKLNVNDEFLTTCNVVDYFLEYVKPFLIKKPKVTYFNNFSSLLIK